MSSEFFDELKDLLLKPVDAFQDLKEKPIVAALGFFAVILLIFSVLSSVVGLNFANPLGLVIGIISVYVFLFVIIFIGAAILHLFVYLVGGRGGVEQTIKAVLYAFTPSGLIGWIPFFGLLGWVWSIILTILGVRELHDLSTGKAVIAVILPVILLVILGVALLSYLTIDPTSVTTIPLN